MDFTISKEQELLLNKARDFAKKYMTEEQVQKWYKDCGVPNEVTKAYLDAGFGYLGIPEEYGGASASTLTLCMITEEFGRLSGAHLPFMQNSVAIYDIVEMGTAEQIKLAMDAYKETGKAIFSIALTEPWAGSDNSAMRATTKEVNGKFVLNGHKTFITNGENFPYALVVAKEEDPSPQNKNMSMWMVKMDSPGITLKRQYKIAQQIMPICEIFFNDVVLDESCLVGKRGKGFLGLLKNLEIERILECALILGEAQAAMDDAAKYAGERIAFGETIGSFQQIQQKITDMEVKLQNMRSFVYKVAWQLDNKQSIQVSSALAKRYIPTAAVEVCSDAIQILGGIGFTTSSRVGRLWSDCRGGQIMAGTDEIMVHIAGRQLIKQYAKKEV